MLPPRVRLFVQEDGPRLVGVFVAVLVVRILLVRIQHAADFTDEAFYAALPYRFVLGDKPFVDELFPSQTAAFVTYPLVWAFVKTTGGTDGILLFMRVVYLVFMAGVGAVVYAGLRSRVSRGVAAVVGLLPVLAAPYCIPALSYNTLGAGFWTIALFSMLRAWEDVRPSRWRFAGGVASALAGLCYPPIVPSLGLMVAVNVIHRRGGLRAVALPWVAGASVIGILIAPVFVFAGFSAVYQSFSLGHGMSTRGYEKLLEMLWACIWGVPFLPGVFLPLQILIFAVLAKTKKWTHLVVPLWMFTMLWLIARSPHAATNWTLITLGLATPFFALVAAGDRRFLLLQLWLPALSAGLLSAYTSSNGASNGGIGLLPAAVLTVALSGELVVRGCRSWAGAKVLGVAVTGMVVLLTGQMLLGASYRDRVPALLTNRISVGPYRGLITTPAKAAFATQLHLDLKGVERSDRKLVSFYDFPAAYLSTKMRPGSPSTWVFAEVLREAMYTGISREVPAGLRALKVITFPGRRTPKPVDDRFLLDPLIEGRGQVVLSRPEYVIYDLPPGPLKSGEISPGAGTPGR